MPAYSPRNVAVRTAGLIAGVSLILSLIYGTVVAPPIDWIFVAVLPVVLFASSYFIIAWAIEKFIYRKVKIIYKNIRRFKRTPGQRFQVRMSQDVLDDVNTDVVNWAEDRVKEITELREKDTFRQEFIGNLSHELKTPLFNIQGYVLTLLEGALEDPENNQRFLEKTARSVDRMVTLLDDLDEISRLEAGELKIYKEDFDIIQLADECVELTERRAKKHNISVSVKNPSGRPSMVYADKSRIEQVLINLVVNSINYGKEQGETFIRFYDMDDTILIEVADDGMGIAKEHLPRIFERFYRVDKSRSRQVGGSGLGLAIVKHIIESHDQTINARSSEGVGSTFSFTLKKSS